jgi:cell division protein FtsQ
VASERRHKSRPRRRRGRFGFAYKLLSVLLVIAAVVTACLVFFRINQVTVTGNARYTAEEIADVSGIRTGDNLIALSKSKIAARIRTRLPYVQSVSIRRALPDTVILTVTEHTAAAAVSDGTNWWYISAQGKLLETVSSPGSIIRITGLTAVEPELGGKLAVSEEYENRLTYVLSLLSALDDRGMLADCTALDCSSAGVLWLDYLNFRLKLPSTGDFSYMLTLLDGAFDSGRVSREDAGTFDFASAEGKAIYSKS